MHLAAFVTDPHHVMVFAVDGDTVVGMASGVEYFHPDKALQLWINDVGVTPTLRRRGIGTALTAAPIAEAKSRGCVYVWLGISKTTLRGKPALIRCRRRVGATVLAA
jgi:GNAT superfamily N-acetyltransferase